MICKKSRFIPAIISAAIILSLPTACGDDTVTDETLVSELVEDYMSAMAEFDISAMNSSSVCAISEYDDGDSIDEACKIIADSITWEVSGVSINGSAAIAQVDMELPDNTSDVCASALSSAMISVEQGSASDVDELANDKLRDIVDKELEMRSVSTEISLSKIGDDWYISQSTDAAEAIVEIRTSVAAVYYSMD